MSQPINRYKADLREIQFVLFEQFKLGDILGKGAFADWGEDEVRMTLNEAHRFATEVTGPLNGIGDEGCKLVDGQVITPPGFKEAWQKLYELGFKSLSVDPEWGGQGAPRAVTAAVGEMLAGSNTAFDMYPSLTFGAVELIESFGTEEQKHVFCQKMFDGIWGGTMCLTEPQAGSDVGLSSTTAVKNPDGSYNIKGTKIFISGGDQDFTDNIIHMVLARVPNAPPGTKGLSLFIVPKNRIDAQGNVTGPNDVKVGSIEHKMGINGSSTCLLNFGEDDGCIGYLVGTDENKGIRQMFQMMNYARIGVGIQGLAVAGAAYLSSLEYARDRKQGASIEAWKDPNAERVAIIEHPDVRRMLLDMKARVEGIRALIYKGASHYDRALSKGGHDDEASIHDMGQIELLTPLVKAYSSDQSFRICETAIQVHGGVGYTKDFPVEQYCRDAKIFSIYEGTNHIQALDLVGRKLGLRGGANMQAYLGEIQEFVQKHKGHDVLGPSVQKLAAGHEAIGSCAMQFLAWFQAGQMVNVPLVANRFLRIMSELTIGWLLLDAAVIALDKQKGLDKAHPDWAFYEGKRHTAVYWAHEVLPLIPAEAEVLRAVDRSPIEIPKEAFATV
jgi:alkylation response protein AidB-like acyl-CoA dehydrogenase